MKKEKKGSDTFLSVKKQYLEEKIKNVELPIDVELEICRDESIKIIADKVLGLFKVTDIINQLLKLNEVVNEKIKDRKLEVFLSSYIEKNDENINKLKNFITSPQGNTLFNKTLRIIDNNPPDKELFEHLIHALNYIINSDFISMFDSHKYVLNLIENISPQGLVIISDYKNWPPFEISASLTYGEGRLSLWSPKFSKSYLNSKNIIDEQIKIRIEHAIEDLISKKIIHYKSEKGKRIAVLTEVGKSLYSYIS